MRRVSGLGVVSLLSAFLMLTLGVFALLTLKTAQTDLRFSQQAAQAVSDYYTAEEAGLRLYRTVHIHAGEGGMERVQAHLPPEAAVLGENQVEALVPVGEKQVLHIVLNITAQGAEKALWRLEQKEDGA